MNRRAFLTTTGLLTLASRAITWDELIRDG